MNNRKERSEGSRSHRILVVEDEGLIAIDICNHLVALGHVVVDTVSTADQAIEMAPQADLILMDIRIDGPRDGIEAAQEIREKCHLPVIFLTASTDRATLARANETAPFAILTKPSTQVSLQSAIEIAVYRHHMQRGLEDQVGWLRSILQATPCATVITAIDGSIRFLNGSAERMTGWTEREAFGRPYREVVRLVLRNTAEGAPESLAEPVELALLRDATVEFDARWRLVDRSGLELVVEGSAAPVHHAREVLGSVLIFQDITARRWQEQQTTQALRMDTATRLAANVAEEYANLSAIIRTQAEHILAQVGEYSPVRRAIDDIRQAAATATQISRRMAGFGNPPPAQLESFTFNSLLRRMGKLIQSAAGEKIKVSMRMNATSGRVHAHSDRIEQAFMNLVVHACASMPTGGTLTLETSQADLPRSADSKSWAMLTVSYTGEEQDFEYIFEPSASADQSLALPIAHAIVRNHEGYLTVQSVPGGGTRLELLLPRLAEKEHGETGPPGSAPAILLVESRELIRGQLHIFFECLGFNLLEAADASEAVPLGQMFDGELDLLIAEEGNAEEIAAALRPVHPSLAVLRVVDRPEEAADEIRRPYSQQALMAKARELLALDAENAESATTSC